MTRGKKKRPSLWTRLLWALQLRRKPKTTLDEIREAKALMPGLLDQCAALGLVPQWKHFRPNSGSWSAQDGSVYPRYYPGTKGQMEPYSRAGETQCWLVPAPAATPADAWDAHTFGPLASTPTVTFGRTYCRPDENFAYIVGRRYSLERALQAARCAF